LAQRFCVPWPQADESTSSNATIKQWEKAGKTVRYRSGRWLVVFRALPGLNDR
jgi:hypothetical protein